eukprot:Hpha_TRINITY_DN15770_c5_g4::TRINITY_DN15770_c5_g4_i1::g.41303::m.41303
MTPRHPAQSITLPPPPLILCFTTLPIRWGRIGGIAFRSMEKSGCVTLCSHFPDRVAVLALGACPEVVETTFRAVPVSWLHLHVRGATAGATTTTTVGGVPAASSRTPIAHAAAVSAHAAHGGTHTVPSAIATAVHLHPRRGENLNVTVAQKLTVLRQGVDQVHRALQLHEGVPRRPVVRCQHHVDTLVGDVHTLEEVSDVQLGGSKRQSTKLHDKVVARGASHTLCTCETRRRGTHPHHAHTHAHTHAHSHTPCGGFLELVEGGGVHFDVTSAHLLPVHGAHARVVVGGLQGHKALSGRAPVVPELHPDCLLIDSHTPRLQPSLHIPRGRPEGQTPEPHDRRHFFGERRVRVRDGEKYQ